MIKFDNVEVSGWEAAIRGMRNSWGSHEKSDSGYRLRIAEWGQSGTEQPFEVGDNDLTLMKNLALGGASHAKYRRYINVTVDITAPLYWWKEFDTYKVGTTANSESTMHTIMKKPFTVDNFSHDQLDEDGLGVIRFLIGRLNAWRQEYLSTEHSEIKKRIWYKIIQTLPSSFNQKRTVQLNYEVLVHIWNDRKNHRLDEWKSGFCEEFIKSLPYSEGIIWNT